MGGASLCVTPRAFSQGVANVPDQSGEKKAEPVFDTFGVAHRHLGAARVVQRFSCEDHQITTALHRNDDGIPKDLSNGFDMTFHVCALGDEVNHKDAACAQDLL